MKLISNIGFILLAIYLILVGVTAIFGISLHGAILGILAIVAGIFILLGR